MDDFTQYNIQTWLKIGVYWGQIEKELIKQTVDINLLEPFRQCKDWGMFLPKVVMTRAVEMDQPIGFTGEALLILGEAITNKESLKTTKYFWMAELAKQLFQEEIKHMEKKNKANRETAEKSLIGNEGPGAFVGIGLNPPANIRLENVKNGRDIMAGKI